MAAPTSPACEAEAKYPLNIATDLKPGEVAPWAEALFHQRAENLGKDHMSVLCLPLGPSYSTLADMTKIIQSPSPIAMLHPDLTYLPLFGDRRRLCSTSGRISSLPQSRSC